VLLQEKAERRPQVLLFAFQQFNPAGLLGPTPLGGSFLGDVRHQGMEVRRPNGPAQVGRGLFGECQVILGMRGSGRLQLPTALQALQPILLERLQQHEARFLSLLPYLLQQALVQERGDSIQHPSCSIVTLTAHRLDRF